ncbi:hypothetical protein [Hymenobacter properus]|uniref:Uncharacterized protein n=1 Tax=Hymenobacter properus TaxID=2791026 RepID=A0A931FKU6_9BACT|nr:hypothetical protein [Hymenobacter properus]MBF9141376.1 hypothetical protein [Hymenobacter properus]MBR7720185.1 hypothetical protein [Microvirga sp. SRT04]
MPVATWRFSKDIDHRIASDTVGKRCNFDEVIRLLTQQENADSLKLRTDWRTDFCALDEFLTVVPPPANAEPDPYDKPVALPVAAGRELYIVEGMAGYYVLLEFGKDRYRASILGQKNTFGGLTHQVFARPDTTLLVLTNVDGWMGAGRGATGEATTRLQIYDLERDEWLLDAPVGRYETGLSSETDDGEQSPGQEQNVSRYYRVLNQARTVVLGRYRIDSSSEKPLSKDSTDTMPIGLFGDEPPVKQEPYPPGTYRLVAGWYQRAEP